MKKLFYCSFIISTSFIMAADISNKVKPASTDELQKALEAHKDKHKAVEFFATWCPHCTVFDNILEDVAKANPDVAILQLDVDKFGDLSRDFEIQGMPTTILLEKGAELKPENKYKYKVKDVEGNEQTVESIVGANKNKLEDSLAVLTGKKQASEITVPVMPKMPPMPKQPEGPLASLGGVGMVINQILGEDLAKELGSKLPPALDKFIQSEQLAPIIDRLVDVIGDVIEEILKHVELTEDVKSKLVEKLGEAKKQTAESFKQVEPIIKQMQPNAHKPAKAINGATQALMEKAKTAVTKQQPVKKAEAKKSEEKKPAEVEAKTEPKVESKEEKAPAKGKKKTNNNNK